MKKLLLATAVAGLSITAQAAPAIYGKVFLTADYSSENVRGDDAHSVKLNSNGSRLGLRGSEPLTANNELMYQLEYRLDVDDKGQRNFQSRDTYLGVKNNQYGTLKVGHLSTVDGDVDYATVATGAVVGGAGVLASYDGNRLGNSISYTSPTFNDMTVLATYQLEESRSARQTTDGGDPFAVAVQYEPQGQPYRVGAAYSDAYSYAPIKEKIKAVRVSGAYDINPMITVGAMYQYTQPKNDKNAKKENSITVSGTMKTATPWTMYSQFDIVKNEGFKDQTSSRLLAGGKYGFNTATTGHVYAGYTNSKVDNVANNLGSGRGADRSGFGVGGGIEYRF